MINVLLAIVSVVVGIALCVFRHAREGKREKVLLSLSMVSLVLFVLYRIAIFQYNYETGAQTFLNSIVMSVPWQLCYACMVCMPIAILTKKRALFAISFFIGPIAGVLTILFPSPAFNDRTILDPTLLTFLLVHCLMVIIGIGLVSTGLYTPCYADAPKLLLAMIPTSVVVHVINLIFMEMGEFTNIMFTMSPSNNFLLELCYQLIPVPLLYTIFPMLAFVLLAVLLVFLFNCSMRVLSKRKRKGALATAEYNQTQGM